MRDYLIFKVGENGYALPVDQVERISSIPYLTPLPNGNPYIDGVMLYQNKSTKVVNFRKITDLPPHETEIAKTFVQVKKDHEIWVESLAHAIGSGEDFKLTTDPHACRLGRWLDSYSTHDPEVLAILRHLMPIHAQLHETGKKILAIRREEPETAYKMLQEEISAIYTQTTAQLERMLHKAEDISANMQKLLIYHSTEGFIAIKVDKIDDIIALDESTIKPYAKSVEIGAYLETQGIIEHKKRLIVVVKMIKLPDEEAV